jgi:oligosaccharyltransferase complex subunit alpha (ribophorin I)
MTWTSSFSVHIKQLFNGRKQSTFRSTTLISTRSYSSSQRRTASSAIISFTQPEIIDTFVADSVATKAATGTTVTYGPYNNVPESSNLDFTNEHQQIVSIHYVYDYPVVAISKLIREAEISHWGANLNIQDNIHLHNAGPTFVMFFYIRALC